jgi:hypothetical protein
MFEHKKGYDSGSTARVLSTQETSNLLASPHIAERLEKHARTVQSLAPKSDDFLYFSIIFLKAAEASLINDSGEQKSVGSEKAWGYWDAKHKWHGNVKPHRNNNGDIFPESELKVAARAWIGMPLCVDHKSDSVDGIRGIILDTHYDEKLKQVVGLCALDRVNYPDLARKVSTGVVRFGSMGTAVETSVCTECQNPAKTARDYCQHIMMRSAWGEINLGLKPIEYSLVVQPAEPGAKLLRCFASIKNFEPELKSYGLNDVGEFVKALDEPQADSLDRLLTSVCGPNGCSIGQRRGIVTAFINHNGGLVKSAALTDSQTVESEFAQALAELRNASGKTLDESPELYEPIFRAFGREFPAGETFTSPDATSGDPAAPATITSPKDSEDTPDYTGTGGDSTMMAGVTPPSDSFGDTGGVGPESYAFASDENEIKTIKALKEEIMNESRLRKRAEMRRRVAYHFGGADGVEPSGTYKDESAHEKKLRETGDKQMHPNPANLGGPDGMVPGDKEVKEKQKRASERMKERVEKHAYYFGGADGVEPSGTYKSEDYHKYWNTDKHMHPNPANTGGTDGMYPGDKETKEKQKRASYAGPALKTRFTQKRNLDGSINKAASKFEVFAGSNLIIATTASTIYGNKLNRYWDFLVSPEYGKKVVASIRESGLDSVARLLTRTAQEIPGALPGEDLGAMPAEPALDAAPMEALPQDDLLGEEAPLDGGDPKAAVESAFEAIEDALADAQEAMSQLSGEGGVEVNIGDVGGEEEAEKLALSRNVLENLKVVIADADQSADELALISATYDKYKRLTAKQKSDLNSMTSLALKDSAEIIGETRALLSMAHLVAETLNKVAEYTETVVAPKATPAAKTAATSSDENTLIAEALELRKRRREALLAKAMEQGKEEEEEAPAEEEDMASAAHDGIGQHPTKSKVTTNTAEEVAVKAPSGSPAAGGSSGGPDVAGDQAYSGTASRQLADQSSPVINHADDGDEDDKGDKGEALEDAVEDVAEDVVEDELESDASDSVVTAKVKEAFLQKKAAAEREHYRVKLRRAYDVGMEMQRKGMIAATKAALNRQVDEVMAFDDGAFEAFKRTVANMRPLETIKTASDLGGVNVGTSDEGMSESSAQPGTLKHQLENIGWS